MPDDLEQMWADLAPVGRSATSGGYHRSPFGTAERELAAWFEEQCRARALRLERDAFGNVAAWWEPPRAPPAVVGDAVVAGSRVLTGSHLDSVVDGGAFDGALGVVSALAALDVLREWGFVPSRPLGVSVFVAAEGSRFALARLGSRLAVGATAWDDVAGLVDRDGVRLGDVVAGGASPAGRGLLADVGTFVELHLEQGRELVDRGEAVGVASGLWAHGRYRFDFVGGADRAGPSRTQDRADPMLTYAMTVLAADKQARLSGQRATFARVEVTPRGTDAVASRVTAWLDVRASSDAALADLVAVVERQATQRAGRDATAVSVTAESVSGPVGLDVGLTGGRWSTLPVRAGHDAGILRGAGIRTAMLLVRNPTGVSHAPAEHAELADCLAGVEALADALAELTR